MSHWGLCMLLAFTLCLVGGEFRGMENIGMKIGWKIVFFIVWHEEENREERKPGRKFSPPGSQISSSQIGRKSALPALDRKSVV